MKRANGSSSGPAPATRRSFLKLCSATVAACLGGVASLTPFRRAFAAVPVWTTIPNQSWTVGVPVSLNLSAYCTDQDGGTLLYSLDRQLPPGVTLNGSIISGTPTASFAAAPFIATADDREDTTPPAAPTDLRTE